MLHTRYLLWCMNKNALSKQLPKLVVATFTDCKRIIGMKLCHWVHVCRVLCILLQNLYSPIQHLSWARCWTLTSQPSSAIFCKLSKCLRLPGMLYQLFSRTLPQQALHHESQVQSISSNTEESEPWLHDKNMPLGLVCFLAVGNKLQFNLSSSRLETVTEVIGWKQANYSGPQSQRLFLLWLS